jgi:CheY-like chemotaxis protein
VAIVHDGLEAYDRLRETECKCMVLDLNMPRMSGSELLSLLSSEGIDIPTIVLTGSEQCDDRKLREYENVVEIMRKPTELSHLLASITRCAEHRTRVTLRTASQEISGDIDLFDKGRLGQTLAAGDGFLELTKATLTDLGSQRTHRAARLYVSTSSLEWITAATDLNTTGAHGKDGANNG